VSRDHLWNNCQGRKRQEISMFQRSPWLCLWLLLATGSALATPVLQGFGPEPEFDVPARLEGYPPGELKRFEVGLGLRLERRPDDPELLHRLGSVLYHQGRAGEARRVWTRAADRDPNLAPAELMAKVQEVFALLAKGDAPTAMKRLESVEARYGDDPHFLLVRAEQAARSGNLDAAERTYRRAAELGPDLYVTQLNLGRFLERRNEQHRARAAFERAAELAPDKARVWNFLGAHQFRQGQFDAALRSFASSEQADPDQPLGEIQMAKLSLEIGDLLGTRRWYRAALAREPENPDPIRVALSDVQLRLELFDEARAEIEAVLEKQELGPLLVALGYVDESQGRPQAAERRYRRALTLHPDNVIASNNLAMLLVATSRNPDEALRLAEAARSQQPNSGQVFGTYACALLHAGREDEARAALSKAIRLSPSDPWARYCYGKALQGTSRDAERRLHLEGALILDSDFPRADEIRRLLKGAAG
jgi:tetratricopeptide (TPR) repeat protein